MTPAASGPSRAGRRVLANAVALFLAYVVPRVFTVVSVVVAARWLGTDDFGAYSTAAAFAVIASVVATLGMLPLLVREIAQEPERTPILLRSAHLVKVGTSTLMVIGVWVAGASLFPADPQVRAAAIVLSLGWVVNAFAENLAAYFQAIEQMVRWTQASALFGVVSATVGVAALLTTGSLVAYCWGFVVGWSSALLWLAIGMPDGATQWGRPQGADVRDLLKGLTPFAAAFVGLTLYCKMDVLLLQRWAGLSAAGVYTAAYKFVDVFQALLIVAAGAVYPHLSRATSAPSGATAGSRSMEIILLVSVPAGLSLHLVAGALVPALYGPAYSGSVPVLSRLALVLPMLGVTILGGYVLGAAGRMIPVGALYAMGVGVNLALNRALIPLSGAEGAATARLGSETLLVVGFLLVLRSAARAPRARSVGIASVSALLALASARLPDPSGGWLRAAIFLGATGLWYYRSGALTRGEWNMLRPAVAAGSRYAPGAGAP